MWFHAFNNAYTALCRAHNLNLTANGILSEAHKVANDALEIFKDVKLPETTNLDLQGLVDSVAKNAVKGTR